MLSDTDHRAVVEFLHTEARLADEARYAEWLALWTGDGVYWVPATTDPAADPERHLSHIYDNRGRIETRIKLLQTGHRYSQEPASLMRRLISNIEITAADNGELIAQSNFASPSWRFRPSASCTGGSDARRTVCAAWTASSRCAERRSCWSTRPSRFRICRS
jgi:3-phenylpropionate/cinnamic acid dioxygenase small subunit